MRFDISVDARKTKILITFISILILLVLFAILISYFYFDYGFKSNPEYFKLNGELKASFDESKITKTSANLIFIYEGPNEMSINTKDIDLSLNSGNCELISITNINTNFESDYELFTTTQKGLLKYNCENLTKFVEGNISISIKNTKSGLYRNYNGDFKMNVEK